MHPNKRKISFVEENLTCVVLIVHTPYTIHGKYEECFKNYRRKWKATGINGRNIGRFEGCLRRLTLEAFIGGLLRSIPQMALAGAPEVVWAIQLLEKCLGQYLNHSTPLSIHFVIIRQDQAPCQHSMCKRIEDSSSSSIQADIHLSSIRPCNHPSIQLPQQWSFVRTPIHTSILSPFMVRELSRFSRWQRRKTTAVFQIPNPSHKEITPSIASGNNSITRTARRHQNVKPLANMKWHGSGMCRARRACIRLHVGPDCRRRHRSCHYMPFAPLLPRARCGEHQALLVLASHMQETHDGNGQGAPQWKQKRKEESMDKDTNNLGKYMMVFLFYPKP